MFPPSNITMTDGKSTDGAAYNGYQAELYSAWLKHSIIQVKPIEKSWAEWKRCMHLLAHQDALHMLKVPLGDWTVGPSHYARQWPYLYSAAQDPIYQSTALSYTVHRLIRNDFDKDSSAFCKQLPIDTFPTDLREMQHTWILPCQIAVPDISPDSNSTQHGNPGRDFATVGPIAALRYRVH